MLVLYRNPKAENNEQSNNETPMAPPNPEKYPCTPNKDRQASARRIKKEEKNHGRR